MGNRNRQAEATRARKRRRVRIDNASFPRRALTLVLFAIGIALIVEGFNQGSPSRMMKYLASRPLCFAIN